MPQRNKYNLSCVGKTTGKIGMIVPFFMQKTVPGGKYTIKGTYNIKMASFATAVSGIFKAKIRFFHVKLRDIWDQFESYYAKRSTAGDAPYLTVENDPLPTSTSIWHYLPIQTKDLTAEKTVCALVPRAYRRIYVDHYIKHLADAYKESELYVTTAGGADVTTPQTIAWDYMDHDLFYDTLKYSQQTGSAVTVSTAGDDFTIQDLRTAISQQHFAERVMKYGLDCVKYIANMFGISTSDRDTSKLLYSEDRYLNVNEIMSTASTDTAPIGGSASVASTFFDDKDRFTFETNDFGIIMGLVSIIPQADFNGGIHHMLKYENVPYRFYTPDYANIGLQAVTKGDLYLDGTAGDADVVGYQYPYQDLRYNKNFVAGEYKDLYDYMTPFRDNTTVANPDQISGIGTTEFDYLYANDTEPHVRIFTGLDILGEIPVVKIADMDNIDLFNI